MEPSLSLDFISGAQLLENNGGFAFLFNKSVSYLPLNQPLAPSEPSLPPYQVKSGGSNG